MWVFLTNPQGAIPCNLHYLGALQIHPHAAALHSSDAKIERVDSVDGLEQR